MLNNSLEARVKVSITENLEAMGREAYKWEGNELQNFLEVCIQVDEGNLEALLTLSKMIASSVCFKLYARTGRKDPFLRLRAQCYAMEDTGNDCVMEAYTTLYQLCIVEGKKLREEYEQKEEIVKLYRGIEVTRKEEIAKTYPMKEAYRSVRRFLRSLHSMAIDFTLVSLEQLIEEGKEGSIIQGNLQQYAPSKYDAKRALKKAFEKMNLTDTQLEVLRLRLEGKGVKSIASVLNISKQGVQKHMKLIRKKAIASGLVSEDVLKEVVVEEEDA